MPASQADIAVATILPAGVTIYSTPGADPPDSSAFVIDLADVSLSQRLGNDCIPCQGLNGTTAIKPAFQLVKGTAANLPADMLSGTGVGGTLTYTITNNLSFDPIKVSTTAGNPQGLLTVLVHSGSLVLGRDVLDGETTALAQGTSLTRVIVLGAGTVTGSISVDLVVESPQGDHTESIDANGAISLSATFDDAVGTPTFLAANARINVVNKLMQADNPTELPNNIDESIRDRVEKGSIRMTIDNPFALTGTLDADFAYGKQPSEIITRPMPLPGAPGPEEQVMNFDAEEIASILSGDPTQFTLSGIVNTAAPITVSPRQHISIDTRLLLSIRVGGEN